MADILILGMEMPTDEPLRLVLNTNGQLFVDYGVTFTEYEAVELPPHGDLIDRDSIPYTDTYNGMITEMDQIDRLPVVIPANKEDTP